MHFLGTLSSMFLQKNPIHLHGLLAYDNDFLYLWTYVASLHTIIQSLCSALTSQSFVSQAAQMLPAFFRARSPQPTDGSSLLDETTFLASQASIGGSTSDSLSTGTSFRALGGASNNMQPFRSIANSDTGTFMHTYTYMQHRMSSHVRIILLSVFYAHQENILEHRASSCSNISPCFVSKIHMCQNTFFLCVLKTIFRNISTYLLGRNMKGKFSMAILSSLTSLYTWFLSFRALSP
jgi:hypothetical protein